MKPEDELDKQPAVAVLGVRCRLAGGCLWTTFMGENKLVVGPVTLEKEDDPLRWLITDELGKYRCQEIVLFPAESDEQAWAEWRATGCVRVKLGVGEVYRMGGFWVSRSLNIDVGGKL